MSKRLSGRLYLPILVLALLLAAATPALAAAPPAAPAAASIWSTLWIRVAGWWESGVGALGLRGAASDEVRGALPRSADVAPRAGAGSVRRLEKAVGAQGYGIDPDGHQAQATGTPDHPPALSPPI